MRRGMEQLTGLAREACVCSVERGSIGVLLGQRLRIEAAGQNRFHGAVERAGVIQRARTSGLKTFGCIALLEPQHALCCA